MAPTTLVTGGTGTLGRAVVAGLLGTARDVRVLSRRQRTATDRRQSVTGDLRSGAGISDAVAGVSTIVHCATTNGRGDVEAARTLIAAARHADNPHLVYISIVGVDVVPLGYYRAKLEVEELIAGSGLPWTVLRATQFHDLITRLFAAQRWAPVVLIPAGVRCQPIDVRDVAARLVELSAGAACGRVPDIGGPEVRGVRDLARAFLRATGRQRLMAQLPLAGKAVRGFRAGGHLTPEHAVGQITYEQFLTERLSLGRD